MTAGRFAKQAADQQAGDKQTRRRGAELEQATLDAAWEQLTAEGYEHFTIEGMACSVH